MSNPTILVVGATGNLGHRVVDALVRRPEKPVVYAGVRKVDEASDKARSWASQGVSQRRADLADNESLDQAVYGVDIVISTVQGGPDVIVDGQSRVLAACERKGVARMVPSDFSLDLFALNHGENWNLDLRRKFDDRLMVSHVGHTFFLNGGFMEAMTSPFIGMVDKEHSTIHAWGQGDDAIDLTSMDNAAAFLAGALMRSDSFGQVVEVVGDRRTAKEIAQDFSEATGKQWAFQSRGSVEEGYAHLENLKREKADLMMILPLQYFLPMLQGRVRLNNVWNHKLPEVKPTPLREFLQQGNAS